ncbi:MAG: hypothetical protein L3J76_04745 [Candidatus Hydrothermae bacterium]|nr:hypothetical protein [Candidatus Hydrothermae bacterium]
MSGFHRILRGIVVVLALVLQGWLARDLLQRRTATATLPVFPRGQVLRLAAPTERALLENALWVWLRIRIGEQIEQNMTWDSTRLYQLFLDLHTLADLDTSNWEIYYGTYGLVAWEFRDRPEPLRRVTHFLIRGAIEHPNRWFLPFFVGFTYFYFLHDSTMAAHYLQWAARAPGAPPGLQELARKFSREEVRTRIALGVLKELQRQTPSTKLREKYEREIRRLEQRLQRGGPSPRGGR